MTMEDLIRRADVVRPMLRLYRYLRKQEKDGEKAGKIIDKALNAAAAACVKECVTTAMEAPAVRGDTQIGPAADPVEIYRGALAMWGPDAQTLMAFEEMAELQKELCKHARGKHNRSAVAEEIADVQIMLEQMAELHGCAAQVTAWREVKLERLLERIKAAEAGKEGNYAGETDERGDRGLRGPLPDGNGGSVRGPAGEIGGEPPGPPEGEGEAGA